MRFPVFTTHTAPLLWCNITRSGEIAAVVAIAVVVAAIAAATIAASAVSTAATISISASIAVAVATAIPIVLVGILCATLLRLIGTTRTLVLGTASVEELTKPQRIVIGKG